MFKGKKILVNSISMLSGRLTQAIATFILTAAIVRILGTEELGQYLLAMSYYYIFVNIASQGFKSLFTREMARESELMSACLGNGTLIQFAVSVIAYALMSMMIFLLPYSEQTSFICYIIGLTIIPFALSNVTEAVFQAQEKMHLIVLSTSPIYILRLVVMIWIMQLGYGVEYVGGILVLSELLIWIVQWLLLVRNVKPQWKINREFVFKTIKDSGIFFVLEGIAVIGGRLDIFVLSLLGSESLIGIYGAIVQLLSPCSIVNNSIGQAGFPAMTKAAKLGAENQRHTTQNVIELLLFFVLPFFVGSLLLGRDALLFIYKNPEFGEQSIIFSIMSFNIITSSFSRIFSYLLVANNYEKFNLIAVVTTTVLGGLAGIIFVPQFKLMGAVFMSLFMTLTYFGIVTYAVYSRLFSLNIWLILRRPLLVSMGMVVVLLILQKLHSGFLLSLSLACVAYCVFITLVAINQFGSISSLWERIMSKKL